MASTIAVDFYIDRGGTFTDIYCEVHQGSRKDIIVMKLLSEEQSYNDGPSEGIKRICLELKQKHIDSQISLRTIIMGSTVVTNCILERKGSRCALLITKGFRDMLQIGTQTRPKIFDLTMRRPEVLYEEVVEIDERVGLRSFPMDAEQNSISVSSGDQVTVIKPLITDEVRMALLRIQEKGIQSIGVCFLHSSIFPDHEIQVDIIAKSINFENISLSSEVSNVIRAVPRGQTAILDSYVNPIIRKYIQSFESNVQKVVKLPRVQFMMSDGGLCESDQFIGSKALLSGPAGGVIGMIHCTQGFLKSNPQFRGVIGFDMGGTSTDVSVYYPESGVEVCYESYIGGINVHNPCFDINTVAAGGGSLLTFLNGMFRVGPESSGAIPGPVCYGRNGKLSVTDANLVLGYLKIEHFPHIFGENNNQPLDMQKTREAFEKLRLQINNEEKTHYTIEDVAKGFITVANETMCRPIRQLTEGRGRSTKGHLLFIFGGAGAQHCTAIADKLQITTIYIHKFASILSAYGLKNAKIKRQAKQVFISNFNGASFQQLPTIFMELSSSNTDSIRQYDNYIIWHQYQVALKYIGSDYLININIALNQDYDTVRNQFNAQHLDQFGFILDRELQLEYVSVVSEGQLPGIEERQEIESYIPIDQSTQFINVKDGLLLYDQMEEQIPYLGPAIIVSATTTINLAEGWSAQKTNFGNIILDKILVDQDHLLQQSQKIIKDPVELSVFGNRFMSIAESMGKSLQLTAISTNIKERLDYSCAIFDHDGHLIANAPHLPVHLGSMSDAVKWQIEFLRSSWHEGDVVLSNHPQSGGSHLPDLTVITPCFDQGKVIFFVASRGHHADIGGITPGSMPPFSKSLADEGVAIMSFKIVEQGVFQLEPLKDLLQGTRALKDNICDLQAQVAANYKGIQLIRDLLKEQGIPKVQAYMGFIQDNAEESVRRILVTISKQNNMAEVDSIKEVEYMDDGTVIALKLTIDRIARTVEFDFSGTGPQVEGNTNCPVSVTKSAVIYCLRCLVDIDIPLNQGCLNAAKIILPPGSLLNPDQDRAIVGGNVLTSQRITDIIFKCFRTVAASQGCMNNFSFGAENISYYETIAGGGGAGPSFDGESGVQVHMTNTRITDVEVIERRYPIRIYQFTLRNGSGGDGEHQGGDGVVREFQFLHPLTVSLLMERRVYAPFGMAGGEAASKGRNTMIKADGSVIDLGGKNCVQVQCGDRIIIESPGGGGYGPKELRKAPVKSAHQYEFKSGSLQQHQMQQEEA